MKKHAFRALVFVAAIAPAAAARAQAPADTAELADLVVTGTPVPTRAGAIAAAVTVLHADELRARGIRFVSDALREVPGFYVLSGGSFGAATSLFARGGESNYVKVLIDGVAVNQPGGGFDFATLSLDNVERIEVVRGPASVVHGSDAVGGVVHVISRTGRGRPRIAAAARAGTFGAFGVEGSASGGTDRAGWSGGFGRFSTDGIYAFNNRFEASSGGARLRFTPDALTALSLAGRYSWNSYAFPTDGSGALADSNQYSTGHTFVISATGERRLSDLVDVAATLGAVETRYEFADAMDFPGDTSGFGFESGRRTDVGRRTADLRVHYRPMAYLVLTGGGQLERLAERQEGWSTSNFGGGAFTDEQPPFDTLRTNRAVYGQATADLPSGLALNAGIRHDDDEAFGGFTTVRGGLAYSIGRGTRIRASAGTAFKTPSFSESFADSPFERGDRALRPERTRSWEVGAEQVLADGVVSLSAAWFDQRFRDFIQYVASDPPEPTYFNLGAATARGLELSIAVRPVEALTLTGEYTRLLTEVTDGGNAGSLEFLDGGRLLRRPRDAVRLGAGYQVGGITHFSLAANVVGSRDDIDFSVFERVRLDGYWTLDASAEVHVLRARGARLALTARLENALDEAYETVVGFPARGRTLYVGVRAGP
ncbi:MAG TPA: TonB-dependent receptor [Gemmatimonadales bacterium]|nr:TonB-dependent receptor [Gemmatimonadales bacterium]